MASVVDRIIFQMRYRYSKLRLLCWTYSIYRVIFNSRNGLRKLTRPYCSEQTLSKVSNSTLWLSLQGKRRRRLTEPIDRLLRGRESKKRESLGRRVYPHKQQTRIGTNFHLINIPFLFFFLFLFIRLKPHSR